MATTDLVVAVGGCTSFSHVRTYSDEKNVPRVFCILRTSSPSVLIVHLKTS